MSVSMPVSYCFYYVGSIICLEIWTGNSSSIVLSSQDCFALPFVSSYEFLDDFFFYFYEESCGVLMRIASICKKLWVNWSLSQYATNLWAWEVFWFHYNTHLLSSLALPPDVFWGYCEWYCVHELFLFVCVICYWCVEKLLIFVSYFISCHVVKTIGCF